MMNELVVSSSKLTLSFVLAERFFSLKGVSSEKSCNFISASSALPPLWRVKFIDEANDVKEYLPETMPVMEEDETGKRLRWEIGNGAVVTVLLQLPADSDSAQMQLRVERVPENLSVHSIHFPCFNWELTEDDECKLIVPADAGAVYPNPLKNLPCGGDIKTKKLRARAWPNGSLSMQFLAVERDGNVCYLGAHDTSYTVKSFDWECNHEYRQITLNPNWRCARQNAAPAESFPWVVSVFNGDWFDVARRYRRFALTAPWVKKGRLAEGNKTPKWLMEIPMVTLRMHDGAGYSAEDIIREQSYFQVPMLVHYYSWSQDGKFFPTLPSFKPTIKALEDAGIKVMPYTDIYSYDEVNSLWDDLKAFSIQLNEDGGKATQNWAPGWDLTTMCTAAPLYRALVKSYIQRLITMGCKGIYFDEFGMSPPRVCCSKEHQHTPADPTVYLRSSTSLMDEIKREANEEVEDGIVFSSEGAGEPYMDQVDTFLVGNGNNPYMKPLFAAVYHDYVMGFGRYMFFCELTDERFANAIESKNAEQFICGWQFGWNRVPWNIYLEQLPNAVAFLKMLAQVRHEQWSFLTCGKMLRPLELEVPTIQQRWAMAWNDNEGTVVELPAVMNSVWLNAQAQVGIFFVNVTDTPQSFIAKLPSVRWGDPLDVLERSGKENYRYPMPEPLPCRTLQFTLEGRQEGVTSGDSMNGFKVTVQPKSVYMIQVPHQVYYEKYSE